MTHTSELLDRLAPMALGLPDADPDGALASHLSAGCESCTTELRELRETVALLELGAEPIQPAGELRDRLLNRITGEGFAFVLSGSGEWREEGGLEVKQLYADPAGSTVLMSLPSGSSLEQAYRPGHLGYVIIRGELDGDGLQLSAGDFIPAAGKAPGRKMAVVMDTVLLAVAGSEAATPLDSPRAVRSSKAAWNPMEPGTLALPLAGSAQDGIEISLVRMEPGAAVARHRHEWVEELCIVSGDWRSQGMELGPEDYHRASPGTTHDVITSIAGCTMVYIIRKAVSGKR